MTGIDSRLALIIDDEAKIRDALAGILEDEGWSSCQAASGLQGIELFKKNRPQLVLLDVWMEGFDGIQTLQELKTIDQDVPVVIMSGHANIETAVKATRIGAFEFLEKPLSIDKILPLLNHASQISESSEKLNLSSGQNLIGDCAAMDQIKRQIKLVAHRNAWVLITGENGTGKEVVARQIHEQSTRREKAFIAVNCAAIPEDLIESELFGHNKGAFTNAVATKQGRFEMAHEGTLFLDEIADMSLKTQAKILRILQEQKFERVGGTETIEVDVRVIAATNKDLKTEIAEGRFREDLFYRLNVVPFALPPLRERGNDIALLSEYFLLTLSKEMNEPMKVMSSEALAVLRAYLWPGNIRELRNFIERLCILTPEQKIGRNSILDLLPKENFDPEGVETVAGSMPSVATTLKQAKTDFERTFILDKLEEHQWNITKTAEAIGVERSNLHKKLKGFGIDPKLRS
ncbi:MAG: sigma-54-dependent Fis family transcriptional regulator [Pseudobacteriovorax sp.]|nr:sigma-54-dependent Fis family transcriptional regulator [Pseudobacteriovorax sp.]